ncbi:ABC transporter ATP-binding protein [Streptomyces sp. NPDC054841]
MGRRYGLGGPWVLRGVGLDLAAGTLVRVEGGNGSGKSTLLRLLAGIDAPTEGRITGRPRTAYVPERFPAALPFTATGYLVHVGRVHGLGRGAAERGAREWLERFGAAGHARTPLTELSKGTSQKVAVAQALLAAPELLVLDEAWTGLDTGARAELDLAVAQRVAAGATVVFVDHDPRRLAGAVDVGHRVEGTGLVPAPVTPSPVAAGAVRIVVSGPPGAALPAGLPVSPTRGAGADDAGSGSGAGAGADGAGTHGIAVLEVPDTHSDATLRALLTARPPWHVRSVAPVPAASDAGAREAYS